MAGYSLRNALLMWLLLAISCLHVMIDGIVLKRHGPGRSKDDAEESGQSPASAPRRDGPESMISLTNNKTIFSDQKRLVFFVGFDSSPHLLLSANFGDCIAAGDCNVIRNFTHQLTFQARNKTDSSKNALASVTDTIQFVQNHHQKRGVFLVPLPETMLKAQFDFPFVASMAEKSGVDMRVLVLLKELDDLNLPVTSRLDLDGKSLADILINLQTQLRRLDPQFYRCFKSRTVSGLSKNEKSSLSTFLFPHAANATLYVERLGQSTGVMLSGPRPNVVFSKPMLDAASRTKVFAALKSLESVCH